MDMQSLMKVKSIGVLSLLVLFLNGCLSGFLRPDDITLDQRAWFGWGEASGVYQEDKYSIDEGTKGITYEGMYEYQVDTKKSSFERTRGVSLLKTDFVDTFDGADGSTHKNNLTILHPFTYHLGYGRAYKLWGDTKFVVSGDLFGGLGLDIFSGEKTFADGRVDEYPQTFGLDLLYGIGLLTILEIEDGLTLGWHRMNMQNKVRMDFGEDAGFLTQYNSTVFFLGWKFSGKECVSTKYIQC